MMLKPQVRKHHSLFHNKDVISQYLSLPCPNLQMPPSTIVQELPETPLTSGVIFHLDWQTMIFSVCETLVNA